jgi:hypothetical protein
MIPDNDNIRVINSYTFQAVNIIQEMSGRGTIRAVDGGKKFYQCLAAGCSACISFYRIIVRLARVKNHSE